MESGQPDSSVIGSAAPVISGKLVGQKHSWLQTYFPEGLQINIGPTMFTLLGVAGVMTVLGLVAFTAKKVAPDEYALFLITLSELADVATPEFSPEVEDGSVWDKKGPFGVLPALATPIGAVWSLFQ